MRAAVIRPRILHVANWYPSPWDNIEGNFVRDQIAAFRQEIPAEVVVVQVRQEPGLRLVRRDLDGGARGYFLFAPVRPGKILEWLSALLMLGVLLRMRAWRFDALHVHIAYPLLIHSGLWRWLIRNPIIISEHWSAYHYNFHLPERSRALATIRKPFQRGDPVLAVSSALLDDIRRFAQRQDLKGFVVPNVVPLHGSKAGQPRAAPVLFAVNRWVEIKNPMPMLQGLNCAAADGLDFSLVIGGYGPLIEAMKTFVETSYLRSRTTFTDRMTKAQIAQQLACSDGYLFGSDYETFSIACAEALGAGVPLIGPDIPAIAEYAGPQDWVKVSSRDSAGWQIAINDFVEQWKLARWDRPAIAQRASAQFATVALRARYRNAMQELGLKAAT